MTRGNMHILQYADPTIVKVAEGIGQRMTTLADRSLACARGGLRSRRRNMPHRRALLVPPFLPRQRHS